MRSDHLLVINPDIVRPASIDIPLRPLPQTAGLALMAEGDVETPLHPGEVRILRCHRTEYVAADSPKLNRQWAETTARIAVEAVRPGGEFPAKTVVGRDFVVSADIFGDGHDVLAADLLWRPEDTAEWQRVRMRKLPNDRWEAKLRPDRIGLHCFAVEGWWDQWGTFTHDLHAKFAAGQDVTLEVQEGRQLVEAALGKLKIAAMPDVLLSEDLAASMQRVDPRPFALAQCCPCGASGPPGCGIR